MDPLLQLARFLGKASLAPANVDLVCSHFHVERFRKETRIVTQGRPYGKLVYVAEGILRVFVVTPEGDEVVKNFVGEMVDAIKASRVVPPEKSAWAANVFGSLLHGPALKAFKASDAQFAITDACTGCGTCAKVCPRGNIRVADGRPTFAHDCELCHACIQWCPQFAIRHPGFDADPQQYRNPAVRLADILRP